MTIALLIIIVATFMLTVTSGLFLYKNREAVTEMYRMAGTMAISMNVSMLGGTIAGIVLSGNLFIPTFSGMMIGFIIGGLLGGAISESAVLEGISSGVMGGMMGAMLGVMIVPPYDDVIVKLLFFMYTLLIIYNLLILRGTQRLNHPLLYLAVFLCLFFALEYSGSVFPENHGHSGHGSHSM
ncbi:hypothetical protein [Thalassobacillus hwangdonensis]|uniref:Uncharacterized protein n=1 Tax=Thalassobacillus hwangdonensis TaxID=546108 RepID=A0ABW3L3C0_9BACI